MQRKSGILFVVSGPSGVGKGTLCAAVKNELKGERFTITNSVSVTTRHPRPGEKPGIDYFFSTREDFLKTIDQDGFLEWAEVHGNYYGTPKEYVLQTLSQGQDILLEIDVQGAQQIREKYAAQGVFIFVLPPSRIELRHRLDQRASNTEGEIEARLRIAEEELKSLKEYDYFVLNSELSKGIRDLKAIIIGERSRVNRYVITEIDFGKGEIVFE